MEATRKYFGFLVSFSNCKIGNTKIVFKTEIPFVERRNITPTLPQQCILSDSKLSESLGIESFPRRLGVTISREAVEGVLQRA